MYESNFKQLLARKSLSNGYFLYGSCRLSLEILQKRLEEFYQADVVLRMSDVDYDFQKALDFLLTNDLFHPRKLLIININKDEFKSFKLDKLKEAARDDAALIVLACTSRVQTAVQKAFGDDFVRVFDKQKEHEKLEILQDYARLHNVQAARNDLVVLAQNYSDNIYEAAGEIRKFAGGKLDLQLCDLSKIGALLIDDLITVLFDKKLDLARFESILQASDEIAVINQLSAAFLRFFKLSAYAKNHGNIDFKVALGYSPPTHVRDQMQRYCIICDDKYEEIFANLLNSANRIMNMQIQPETELLSVILRIYNLLTKN